GGRWGEVGVPGNGPVDRCGGLFARFGERANIAAEDALAEKGVVDRIDGRRRLRRYLRGRFARDVFAAVGVLENREDDHRSVAAQLSERIGGAGEDQVGEIVELEIETPRAELRV